MTRSLMFVLGALLAGLMGCSSAAPPAPLGFDRQPANSPDTISSLTRTGDHTPPPPATPAANDRSASPIEPVVPLKKPPVVLSDFSAPAGIRSLTPNERDGLISDAKSAQTITLLCRGDSARPDPGVRGQSLRRGVKVKQFLVAQGVDPRRIRIFVRSAGAFVANNATANGRAKNRRVEIHLT